MNTVNVADAYKQNGQKPFYLDLVYEADPISETPEQPVDLTGCTVVVPIINASNIKVWEFSTLETIPEKTLAIDGTELGRIHFPNINKWEMQPGTFLGDITITDDTGFEFTYGKLEFIRRAK